MSALEELARRPLVVAEDLRLLADQMRHPDLAMVRQLEQAAELLAELERLRGIEQRARLIAERGDSEGRRRTARSILGEQA